MSRADGIAQRILPNPALLRLRLQQTGKSWTLAQYGLVSLGIIAVVSLLLLLKGLPVILAVTVGLFAGAEAAEAARERLGKGIVAASGMIR